MVQRGQRLPVPTRIHDLDSYLRGDRTRTRDDLCGAVHDGSDESPGVDRGDGGVATRPEDVSTGYGLTILVQNGRGELNGLADRRQRNRCRRNHYACRYWLYGRWRWGLRRAGFCRTVFAAGGDRKEGQASDGRHRE